MQDDTPGKSRKYSCRQALTTIALVAAGLMGTACGVGAEETAHRPLNVLFIMTDQHRADAMSCAGRCFVETPNLDRLAREGVRFSNAVSASPTCAPCRTSILTGQPIHIHEVVSNEQATTNHCREGITTFDACLASKGYHAEYRGRWHAPPRLLAYEGKPPMINEVGRSYREYLQRVLPNQPALKQGQFPHPYSQWPYTPDPIDYEYRHTTTGWDVAEKRGGRMYGRDTVPAAHTVSAMVADESIEALQRLKNEPFILTSSFLHPHSPLIVAEPYIDQVSETDMVPPQTLYDKQENGICGQWYRWFLDDFEKKNIRTSMARYYAAVKELDMQVGRVLDTLDELGLTDNTLVIYTSDHGEMLGAHGMHQKFVPYRESLDVPLLLRLPDRIQAGRVVNTPVNIQDLYATILDYTGTPGPPADSHSLRPLIEGKDSPRHGTVVVPFSTWYLVVQDSEWKYVWSNRPDEVDLLFNMKRDPLERVNLVGKNPDRDQHVPKAREMKAKLLAWAKETRHPWLEQMAAQDIK